MPAAGETRGKGRTYLPLECLVRRSTLRKMVLTCKNAEVSTKTVAYWLRFVEALPARHIGEGSIATLRRGCKHEGADKHRTCPSGRLSVCCVSLTRCLRSNEHGAIQGVLVAAGRLVQAGAIVLSSHMNSTSRLHTMIRQAQTCLRRWSRWQLGAQMN